MLHPLQPLRTLTLAPNFLWNLDCRRGKTLEKSTSTLTLKLKKIPKKFDIGTTVRIWIEEEEKLQLAFRPWAPTHNQVIYRFEIFYLDPKIMCQAIKVYLPGLINM